MEQLKGQLAKGLYVDNLYELGHTCRMLAGESNHPAVLFLLAQMFYDFAWDWSKRPVTVEEAEGTAASLSPRLDELLASVERGDDLAYRQLNLLVRDLVSGLEWRPRLF